MAKNVTEETTVIWVTKLDGTEIAVNSEHILTAEATPDTVLALRDGERLLVKESVAEIMARFLAFRQRAMQGFEVRQKTEAS